MSFQDNPDTISWRLHLKSPAARFYRALSTNAGRAAFRAESAEEHDEKIHFVFPDGIEWEGQVL